MSTLKATTIEPATGTNVTLGTSGDTVALPGNTLVLDTWKDSGGNTLFSSNGSGTVSSVNSAFTGDGPVLIQSQTASSSSSVAFTSGIDSSYDEYVFYIININPSVGGSGTDGPLFGWQCNASGQSGYNEVMTTTAFGCYHRENGASDSLGYQVSSDQAEGTAYQNIFSNTGAMSDAGACAELHIFNPASTTYVKQFWCRAQWANDDDPPYCWGMFTAGFVKVAAALTEFDFKPSSGTFDGTIKLYGVK